MSHVWVIEMLNGKKWEPCQACALIENEGLANLVEWRLRNPDHKFRLTKYAPVKVKP